MSCQRCGSVRVLKCNAHASDCQSYSLGDREHNGYAPAVADICDGDDLFPSICLKCGQVQGKFPKPLIEILESPRYQYSKAIQYKDRIYGNIDAEMIFTWDGKRLNLDEVILNGEDGETIGNAQARLDKIPDYVLESERVYFEELFATILANDPELKRNFPDKGLKFLGKL